MKVDPSTTAIGAQRTGQAPSATDFRQFAALRRGAEGNDPKVLREAAKQFESLFTKMMLESMRKASMGDSLFGSDQGDMYQGMMDDQLAVTLSQGKGIGLADMLIRQLSHGSSLAAGGAGEGAELPLPDAGATGMSGTTAPTSQVPNKLDDARKQAFVDEILPHAEAAARELGVDARAIVAQAALETGWGTSRPADSNGNSHNSFGIKAGASWRGASVASDTTEFTRGRANTENARFRSYGDVAEGVADYVRVIRDNPRYASALNTGSDVRAFATALQRGGYATDPDYANKIMAVAERLGLAAPVTAFKSTVAEPIAKTESSRMSNDA
ncbi:MAG TPA: flagellar assembly peptidoglycan hydrolase FlgJ [Steroidobacteraceae bacterium]|nr:flagellar assembly peptidoglycan hydrolase FlgJ [Steroidobacteraceae bacterium]